MTLFTQQLQTYEATLAATSGARDLFLTLPSIISVSNWDSCRAALYNQYTLIPTTYATSLTTQCLAVDPNSLSFLNDPCCNKALLATQCCIPLNAVKNFELLVADNEGVGSFLDQVAWTEYLELDQLSTLQRNIAVPPNRLYSQLTSFMTECQQLIYNQPCQVNSDCLYSQICNLEQSAGQSLCSIDWNRESEYLIACFMNEISIDLLNEMLMLDSIPFFRNQSTLTDIIREPYLNYSYTPNCVGPSSTSFAHQETISFEPTQNLPSITIVQEGDAAGCVVAQGCNWNFPGLPVTDQETCVGAQTIVYLGASFCGLRQGSIAYTEFSIPQACIFLMAQSPNECRNYYGGFWNSGFCVDYAESIGVMSGCLTSPLCTTDGVHSESGLYSNAICAQDHCISISVVANASDCETIPGSTYWSTLQKCVRLRNDTELIDQSTCASNGMQYYSGKLYSSGVWTDQTQCTQGVCTAEQFRSSPLNESSCSQQLSCTKSCFACESNRVERLGKVIGVCYDVASASALECSQQYGLWNETVGACLFPYHTTAAQCQQINQTFFSCATSEICRANATWQTDYLQCGANFNAICASDSECVQPRCNDASIYAAFVGASNGGVCIRPFQFDTYGRQVQCIEDRYSTRAGCVLPEYTNATACVVGAGARWYTAAQNEAQCDTYGDACFASDWDWKEGQLTAMTSATCAACERTYREKFIQVPGAFTVNTLVPLEWVRRNWASLNQWQLAFDPTKFTAILFTYVDSIYTRQLLNQFYATFGVPTSTMPPAAGGANTTLTATPLIRCRYDIGRSKVPCGPYTFYDNATLSGALSYEIVVHRLSLTALLTMLNAQTYSIVTRPAGIAVGQVIGGGISYDPTLYPNGQLCVPYLVTVPHENPDYAVADIIVVATRYEKVTFISLPLNRALTRMGLTYCTDHFNSSLVTGNTSPTNTTYFVFPILRAAHWETYNNSHPADDSSTASLSVAVRVVIAVVVVLCLILIGALLTVACTRTSTNRRLLSARTRV